MRKAARWAALGVWLVPCLTAQAERTLSADAYLDRLKGMWLGELIGNYAGRQREGRIADGGLVYPVNWTDPDHVDPETGRKDYVFRDDPWSGDDDTCFEYLYLDVLGGDPDPANAVLAAAWADHVEYGTFYFANKQARWLIEQGELPPTTGAIARNDAWWAIDSQITTEALGGLSPGTRQRAAELAGRCGRVTNDGFAAHAAQFYAAMYAAAACESDVETLVELGKQVVPTTSRTRDIIDDVQTWYQQDKADDVLDWRATQSLIYDRYCANAQGRYYHWVESSVNTAATVLGILYGQGDFTQTVEITVQAGWDADCNPATAGGLIGLIDGYAGLPQDVRDRAAQNYRATSCLLDIDRSATLDEIAADLRAAAEQQIVLAGGWITGEGAARTYHLGDDVLDPLVERPDPVGPGGLVAAVQAVGGTVDVHASIERHISTDDRHHLEGIIDGISDPRYNGRRAYSTYDGVNAQPAGGDWYELDFDRPVLLSSLVFHEGELDPASFNSFPDESPPDGGFFADLTVEVQRDGGWVAVDNLVFSEALDMLLLYQSIELSFEAVVAEAIRIRGAAGGTSEFTTIMELEAFGALCGDADADGDVDDADLSLLLAHFGTSADATWGQGDFDDDGDVDETDLGFLLGTFGYGPPEPPGHVPAPPTALLLVAGAGLLCRPGRKRQGGPARGTSLPDAVGAGGRPDSG